MIIVNSLAVLYLYNQFSNLRKVGSKYLLGMYVHVFTLFIFLHYLIFYII